MTTDRDAPPSRLETEFGLTPDEAADLKRAIQYLEASGPQRWERAGRIVVPLTNRGGGGKVEASKSPP